MTARPAAPGDAREGARGEAYISHPRYVLASLRSLKAGFRETWAIRLFGRPRFLRNGDGSTVTLRVWRGHEYLWHFTGPPESEASHA